MPGFKSTGTNDEQREIYNTVEVWAHERSRRVHLWYILLLSCCVTLLHSVFLIGCFKNYWLSVSHSAVSSLHVRSPGLPFFCVLVPFASPLLSTETHLQDEQKRTHYREASFKLAEATVWLSQGSVTEMRSYVGLSSIEWNTKSHNPNNSLRSYTLIMSVISFCVGPRI